MKDRQTLITNLLSLLRGKDTSSINDNKEAVNILIYYCDILRECFDELTLGNTSVTIKVITQSEKDDAEVLTLVRDTRNSYKREPFKSNIKHSIKENTSYLVILSNLLNDKAAYYINNDISKASHYQNTSFKFFGSPFSTSKKWTLPYISEIVVPIITNTDNVNEVLGFLCVDCDKKKAFDEMAHPIIMQFCTDYIIKVFQRLNLVDKNSTIESEVEELVREEQSKKQVFVSHSSLDKTFVKRLCSDIEREDFYVWVDEKNMVVGDIITDKISDGINNSDFFLIVLSPASINSKWVKFELDEAYNEFVTNSKKILPILTGNITDDAIPSRLKKHLYADFRNDYDIALRHLINGLKK